MSQSSSSPWTAIKRRKWWAAAGLALAVAATGTAVVLSGDRDQPGSRTPFVLPALAAAPTSSATEPAGAQPSLPTTALPDSAAASAARAARVEPLPPSAAIAELRSAGDSAPSLVLDVDAHVRGVAAAPGSSLPRPPGAPATNDPVTAAAAFVNRYGEGLGLRPDQHAALARVDSVPGGDVIVRFQQQLGGVPVMGGDVVVAVNDAGGVVSVSAETPPDTPTTSSAKISRDQAGAAALAIAQQRTGLPAKLLAVTGATLWYFDPRVLGVPGTEELRLTWWVRVGSVERGTDLQSVFVDATSGSAVFTYSEIRHAKDRVICDLANAQVNLDDYRTYDCSVAAGGPPIVRREGGSTSAVSDVNQAYEQLGVAYDYFWQTFGRDSIDGHGSSLIATVRACTSQYCPYPNAFWDGVQMVFGGGFAAADDVVVHELTHGVTQHTSQLFYFAESGGINEALSDIIGEFVDQSRGSDNDSQWLLGEDIASLGPFRSMSNPPLYGDPDRVGTSAYTAALNDWQDNYGVHSLSGVVNKTAYLLAAGGTFNGHTVTAIGQTKSAQVWYRLMHLLPSGAEMRDLSWLLPTACRSVIGLAGITAADCLSVETATYATELAKTGTGFNEKERYCPDGTSRGRTLFTEDFERGANRWSLAGDAMMIPSPSLPVSWASSGMSALYTYTPPGTAGSLLRLDQPITIPDGSQVPGGQTQVYAHFLSNVTTSPGGGQLLYNQGGSSWTAAMTVSGFSKGYDGHAVHLGTNLAGPLNLAIRPTAGVSGTYGNEWLVDDIELYLCEPIPSAPSYVAAELSTDRTQVSVSWGTSLNSVAVYEVSITPDVPGFAEPAIIAAAAQRTLTITGLDPDRRYLVAVRAINGDGFAGSGRAAYAPSDPLFVCSVTSGDGERTRTACPSAPPLPPLTR